MVNLLHVASLVLLGGAAAQDNTGIWDIWQTTWDRSMLLTYFQPDPAPINFGTPGAIGSADIVVDPTTVYQTVYGFGAALTDSSASLFSTLKSGDEDTYWSLLDYLFNATDGANAAGFSYIRVPLGASDFSANVYSFDDVSGDTNLDDFSVYDAPDYVFSTLQDILSVNNLMKVHIVPWSPPGWMKDTGTMDGGELDSQYIDTMANYLLMSVQGFENQGIPIYAVGIQNEPENSDTTYPTCDMPVATEAAIGTALRTLLDDNGYSSVILIGYEHNWSDAANYPVELMQQAGDAFAGVSFHCYDGDYEDQAEFTSQYPDKQVYFNECTGSLGSDWWSDIKWYMDNLFIGAVTYGAMNGLMWNLALDGNGQPLLSGSDSCAEGCRGVVQINSDNTWSVNQEFYAMGQASKAILPKSVGGPFGQRIGVSVGGDLDWTLIVGAYVTEQLDSDYDRYALVVLNWYDNSTGTWDPQSVETTIEFQGTQATYTFPVGVTTLSWYAVPS